MLSLRVLPEEVTVELKSGETILDALQRAGYAYRVGCRRGGCGICKVNVVRGDVTYVRPLAEGVLSDEDQRSGIAVSCRAVPETDITITLRDDTLRLVAPFLHLPPSGRSRRDD